MKHRWMGLFLAGAMLFFTGCGQGAQSADGGRDSGSLAAPSQSEPSKAAYHKISAEEAKEKIDAGNVTIVDVRSASEYAEKHIPGAVLVPNESIGATPPEKLPDLDAVLLVYCRTGVRSKDASGKLAALGYRQVYDMGGIVDWTYETEAGQP